MKQVKITILGMGNVGAAVASILLSDTTHAIRLNLVDPSKEKEGTFLDISHASLQNLNHRIFINDSDEFLNADYIVHAAGYRITGGGSRLELAEVNSGVTREIFSGVSFRKNPYIIVITNPVDIISYRTWKYSNIDPHRIVGTGTLLDSIRLKYFLSRELNCDPENLDTWVLGEHGETQVPVYSQTFYNSKNISEWLSDAQLQNCFQRAKNAADEIRKSQGAVFFGVAHCTANIFNSLESDVESFIPVSMQINDHYKHILKCEKDIFISLPVRISERGIAMVNDFPLSSEEAVLLGRSAEVISSFV